MSLWLWFSCCRSASPLISQGGTSIVLHLLALELFFLLREYRQIQKKINLFLITFLFFAQVPWETTRQGLVKEFIEFMHEKYDFEKPTF